MSIDGRLSVRLRHGRYSQAVAAPLTGSIKPLKLSETIYISTQFIHYYRLYRSVVPMLSLSPPRAHRVPFRHDNGRLRKQPALQVISEALQPSPAAAQPAPAAAHHDAAPPPQAPHQGHQLFQWVQQTGGTIQPSLAVVENAPCGCRGIIAAADISEGSCHRGHLHPEGPQGQPVLVAVPWQLCMSDADAVQLLSTALAAASPGSITKEATGSTSCCRGAATAATTSACCHSNSSNGGSSSSFVQAESLISSLLQAASSIGLRLHLPSFNQQERLQQRLRQLQPPMLLALLLAHQCRLGPPSLWHHYIASLPKEPPCAWYSLAQQQLAQQVPSLQHSDQQAQQLAGACTNHRGAQAAAAAAAAVVAKCEAAAGMLGPALGGITAAEVAWAYGQVVSRAYATGLRACSGGEGLALVPVVDLLNHAAGAAAPARWLMGDAAGAQAQQPQQPGAESAVAEAARGFWCVWHQQADGATSGAAATATTASSAASSHASFTGAHTALHGAPNSASITSGIVAKAGAIEAAAGEASAAEAGEAAAGGMILQAGQELYVSYMASCDAASAWLSFGFVPPELQECPATGQEAAQLN